MTENFPNLEMGKATQVQEVQRVPIKMNPKRPTPRHTVTKVTNLKDKERISKAAREKQEITYKRDPIRLAADFLNGNTPIQKRLARNIPRNMESNSLQPRLLYQARLSIKMEGKKRSFPDKRSLKEYTSSKPSVQEMPKGFPLRTERKTERERGTQVQKHSNE